MIKSRRTRLKNGARPKSRRHYQTHPHHQGKTHDNYMTKALDDLAEFEEFKQTTLKAIRKDIRNGKGAKELREKYAAIVQGRLISDALTTEDQKVAAAIGKDVIDRVEGKATEKKEVTHKFKDMKDAELDAILKSEIEELEDMEKRFEQ